MTDTLYFDLDSTLLDTRPLYEEAQMELFGKVMPYEQITHWYAYRDFHGDNFYGIFDHALSVDMIPKRRLYDGAREALSDIHAGLGLNIHIISHNTKPKQLYEPYKAWLDEVIPVPFEFTLFGARNCKIKTMQADPNALGIVEDKGETIRKAVKAGYPTFVKVQPWNVDERTELRDSIHVFDELMFLPLLVQMAMVGKENDVLLTTRGVA